MLKDLSAAKLARAIVAVFALSLVASMVLGASSSRIVWEAENYTSLVAPMTVGKAVLKDKLGNTASGGKYMTIPPKPHEESNAKAVYKVKVAAGGTYTLFGRKYWQDGCGNSFNVRVNGGKAIVFGEDGTYNKWDWRKVNAPIALKSGVNTVELFQNKKERGVNLDQFVLQRGYGRVRVPVKAEKPTPNVIVKE